MKESEHKRRVAEDFRNSAAWLRADGQHERARKYDETAARLEREASELEKRGK